MRPGEAMDVCDEGSSPGDTASLGILSVEAPVAPFVQQLFKMVNSKLLIGWSEDGSAIVVPDPPKFAAEICPMYFRHKNWNSFARMMNMYQFHKTPAEPGEKRAVFSCVHRGQARRPPRPFTLSGSRERRGRSSAMRPLEES